MRKVSGVAWVGSNHLGISARIYNGIICCFIVEFPRNQAQRHKDIGARIARAYIRLEQQVAEEIYIHFGAGSLWIQGIRWAVPKSNGGACTRWD